MNEKPTTSELEELLKKEAADIRELFASPLGQSFVRWLQRRQNLDKMFHQDPYIMAYRCAIHDVIALILDIGDPHNG